MRETHEQALSRREALRKKVEDTISEHLKESGVVLISNSRIDWEIDRMKDHIPDAKFDTLCQEHDGVTIVTPIIIGATSLAMLTAGSVLYYFSLSWADTWFLSWATVLGIILTYFLFGWVALPRIQFLRESGWRHDSTWKKLDLGVFAEKEIDRLFLKLSNIPDINHPEIECETFNRRRYFGPFGKHGERGETVYHIFVRIEELASHREDQVVPIRVWRTEH